MALSHRAHLRLEVVQEALEILNPWSSQFSKRRIHLAIPKSDRRVSKFEPEPAQPLRRRQDLRIVFFGRTLCYYVLRVTERRQ